MKILHVTESFGAGVYSFLVDLCNELSDNHDIIVVYSERSETPSDFRDDFKENIKFIKMDMGLKKALSATNKLKKIIVEEHPEIIHLHSSKAGLVGRIASRLLNYKGQLYYNPHGLSFLRKDIGIILRWLFFISEKILAKLGGLIIAVSESEKEEVKRISPRVISINNGINIVKMKSEEQLDNDRYYNEKSFTVGTVGRVAFQKNPALFNKIAMSMPNVNFIWIGDGEMKGVLSANNVLVTGWLNRKEVLKKVASLDVYVQTSLWEGLPISVLEAMYLKKPLVLSKTVGNVDLVNEGKNGFICSKENDFIEKINFYEENKKQAKLDGESSFEYLVEHFDKEKGLNQYIRLYEENTTVLG
ncbi:glycosyltransferase [Mangrovibacillus sp. Mu-81]|uniref:glycosyltransferase n=1 Tax=Mangrovibacillus sp. Mu-81 TaxID=3121478 RepID=UPI002FE47CD1